MVLSYISLQYEDLGFGLHDVTMKIFHYKDRLLSKDISYSKDVIIHI